MTDSMHPTRRTAIHRIVVQKEDFTGALVMERTEEFNKTLPVPFKNLRYLVVAMTHS